MADVFVSYDRRDRDLAEVMVAALRAEGLSVWWDDALTPHERYDRTIQRELDQAGKVLVLWTPHSTESEWVREEATYAKEATPPKLIPAKLVACRVPLGFGLIQQVDLIGWTPETPHEGWDRLLEWLKARTPADAPAAPSPPIAAPPPPVPAAPAAPVALVALRNLATPVSGWKASLVHALLTMGLAAGLGLLVFLLFGLGMPREGRVTTAVVAALLTPILVFLAMAPAARFLGAGPGGGPGRLKTFLSSAGLTLFGGGLLAAVAGLIIWPFTDFYMGLGWAMAGVAIALGLAIILLPLQPLALFASARLGARRVLAGAGLVLGSAAMALGLAFMIQTPDDLRADIDHQLARTGYGHSFEDAAEREAAIRRFQEDEGLTVDGQPGADLLSYLEGLPDKTRWVLAADGTGDATTLREILERAALDAVIEVRPGVYPAPAHDPIYGEGYNLSYYGSIYTSENDTELDDIRYQIIGAGHTQVVFEVGPNGGFTLAPGDILASVTVRLVSTDQATLSLLALEGAGALARDVVVEGANSQNAVFVYAFEDGPATLERLTVYAGQTGVTLAGSGPAIIRNLYITGGGLRESVSVGEDVDLTLENSQIVSSQGACLSAHERATAVLRNNVFLGCNSGAYVQLWSSGQSVITLEGDQGVTDSLARDGSRIDQR